MKRLFLDIETTGIPAKGLIYENDYMDFPRILSLAFKIDDAPVQEYIINQEGLPIPPEASAINGITDEIANNSPLLLSNVLEGFLSEGKDANLIIGHNIYFDTSIIKANILRLVDDGKLDRKFFDDVTEMLHKDKRVDTMRGTMKFMGKWPKLGELYRRLFDCDFDGHSASNDVEALHKCYFKLLELEIIKEKNG